MLTGTLLLAAGLALVAVSVWRRRGRGGGRAWARDLYTRQGYLYWLPGFGLILVGAGLIRLGEGLDLFSPLVVIGALGLVVGMVVGLWGGLFLPAPAWFLPPWLRPVVAKERRDARARRTARRERRRGAGAS